ncbi:nitrate regulatory gene2 protein-like isoform X1 [Cucurbita pepo subsp. pepo]|uniref:nitrate regulatory gene2 protein-like isoform X1 n=1 Tax=Cucurbita pepo subsp. pepo TaxID=3664 RepID=UPI000C9D6052|nr:nitrate regulatory gene2 protein-like isoform X1 [Cucurbita pepo subsp. pepo]
MGSCYSRLERGETVSRCKARERYMKQLVKARQAFSASHSLYIRSLRGTGAALRQFSNEEIYIHPPLHHHLPPEIPSPTPRTPPPPPPPPPPPIPMSPSSDTWTSTTASTALPPPPPPPLSSTWDFWDPFVPSTSRTEEEWEATTIASEARITVTGAASSAPPPSVVSGFSKDASSTELAVVVSRNTKDLVEIIKELDEYFLKAAEAGAGLSVLLEVPTFSSQNKGAGQVYSNRWSLSPSLRVWGSNTKPDAFGKLNGQLIATNMGNGYTGNSGSHCSTVEKLYAWEKKLYQEVKIAEAIRIEHEKKVDLLRKLELRRADYLKTEKTKKEVEKLESQMMVASQAIETTSTEIIKLREIELYPQLLEFVKGLMCMWRSMYECHQVQTHIVEQLKYLNILPSAEPTSEIHRQSTLQLELEVQQWHGSFCNLVKAQRDYVQSLTGWLRLSLFQISGNPLLRTDQHSRIYELCEEWNLAVDRIPEKVASEGIKSFLTVIHAIVVQQAAENRQRKKADSALKELDKRANELRSLESKYVSHSMRECSASTRGRDPVQEKKNKVENLRTKARDEKQKYESLISVTRSMTIYNLQMSFPHVFQAMVGFSSVCMHAYEAVYNQTKNPNQHEVKRLLP